MSEALKRTISGRLLASRNHAGLTQEQLAALIGRSVEAVSNIERGISLPTLDTINRIANAVSVPIAFFFSGITDAERPNADAAFKIDLLLTKLSARDASLLIMIAQSMTNLSRSA